jgi:hypothetical protein
MQGIGRSTGQANTALVNFGRVVQDAPFGLIGIANNIDPLITSFQQLKASSGSTKAALSSLAAAFTGPAGIAIGISAATSLLIAFGDEIAAAVASVSDFDKIQREAATEAATAYKTAQLEFRKYTDIINDGNTSTQRQKDILDKANQALGEYGLKIQDVAAFQKNAGEIGLLYAEIKKLEAKSTVLAAKSAEEYAKRIGIITELEQNDGIAAAKRAGILATIAGLVGNVGSVYVELNKQLNNSVAAEKRLDAENANLQDSITALVKALGEVPGVVDAGTKSNKKSLQDLRDELDAIYAPNDTRLRESLRFTKDQYTEQYLWVKAINAELDKRRQKEQGQQVGLLVDNANGTAIAKVSNDLLKIPAAIEQAKLKSKEFGETYATGVTAKLQETLTIFDAFSPLIDQTFNALANGQDAFEALRQGVKRLIVELIKAVALAAILSTIDGGASSATGLTSVIGKLLGFKGFRANGGPVGAGNAFLVGERGPELFVPNQSGRIMNNSAMIGAGGMQIIPTLEFSYDNLRIAFNRANASAGRRL